MLAVETTSHGVSSLRHAGEQDAVEFILPGYVLGDIELRYRVRDDWKTLSTASRTPSATSEDDATLVCSRYAFDTPGGPGLTLESRFTRCRNDRLAWTIRLDNTGDRSVEIGDLFVPLAFNTAFTQDPEINYTRRLLRHGLVAGHGSFLFCMRPDGVGPYLVMLPREDTGVEYFAARETAGSWEGIVDCYLHAGATASEDRPGTWRLPRTTRVMAPLGADGDRAEWGFVLRWADNYQGVRDVLCEEGGLDVRVVPGMTLPSDLTARVAIRSREPVEALEPEHAADSDVDLLEQRTEADGSCLNLYALRLRRLGENRLRVRWGRGRIGYLEFFATEPLEALIRKRAAFLVDHQQHRDPSKWYDGLISIWDMRHAVLRGPDDTDGFDGGWGYVLATDDSALCKAPFVALKNLSFPEPREIEALEYYIERFVWGGLQRTGDEQPYPYGVYGAPNWKFNRQSGDTSPGQGIAHVWRTFDYAHIIALYACMHRLARIYPGCTRSLDAAGYLERAYRTAMAYFRHQDEIDFPPDWPHWAYKIGGMNEAFLPEVIGDLEAAGRYDAAAELRAEWEKKVKYFLYDTPLPYSSEMPFDSTAFEATQVVGRYAWEHSLQPDEKLWFDRKAQTWYSHPAPRRNDALAFMERQAAANIACRGWLETAYHSLGSDYRQTGSVTYLLSYMSQLGGWALLDNALFFMKDPFERLQLAYASVLSSWALVNSGTPDRNYGYWFPGEANDGAAGWAFEPQQSASTWLQGRRMVRGPWHYDGEIDLGFIGALRAARAIAAEDPVFGWIAYGGRLSRVNGGYEILPADGLRQRVSVLAKNLRLHIEIAGAGLPRTRPVLVSMEGRTLEVPLESRYEGVANATVAVAGLPEGAYRVEGLGRDEPIAVANGESLRLAAAITPGDSYTLRIRCDATRTPRPTDRTPR